MKRRCIDYVNVFMGTAGSGHAIAGPQLPHGMMKLNPDTDRLPCAGYDYTDLKILGFSHTHTEGAGASGGRGNILLTGCSGSVKTDEAEYGSTFDHEWEEGRVGYYKVNLNSYNIDVELTSSYHTGFHKYTFFKSDPVPYLIVDIGHTLGSKNNCTGLLLNVLDKHNLNGYGEFPIVPGKGRPPYVLYYHIEFNQPVIKYGLWDNNGYCESVLQVTGTKGGGCFWFDPQVTEVCAKVSISYVSVEKARENMMREIPHWNFFKVVSQAENEWEKLLSRVILEGRDEDKKCVFYSGLYRALNQPVNYNEYGVSLDLFGEKPDYDDRGFYLDDWAIWDTFRTTHPLQTIIDWETRDDIIYSLIKIYEKGGWLPVCTSPNKGYHPEMIGHNAISVILDALVKGYDNFDIDKAFEAAKKSSMEYSPELRRLGTPLEYLELGYIPGGPDCVDDNFCVSITMEFAYADWCTAMLAKLAGKEQYYEYFIKRAMNYANLFDRSISFARRKDVNGEWIHPFDPSDSFKNGFCECSSWEYTFFVPHDVQGLINLTGGKEAFINKLDNFFEGEYFNYLNETSLQVPYLYVYAGAPWKTQYIVRIYADKIYKNAPDGLWGEDDAGAMSAWYVFSAMGFFPVCPGQGAYVLGSPLFDKVTLKTKHGKQFIIEAKDNSVLNIYVEQVLFNGEPYLKSYLTHEMLTNGGILTFIMSDKPNYSLFKENVPPSLSEFQNNRPLNIEKINYNPPDLKFYGHSIDEIKSQNLCCINDDYLTHKTTEAYFFQNNKEIIIYSKGNMSRTEYGIVYLKEPVIGDFEVQVTISRYDLSSPYAPAGILISDNIRDIDIYGLGENDITAGAMAKRGYYIYGYSPECVYSEGYKYAFHCPKPGCTIKLIKLGDEYLAYYKETGMENWQFINSVRPGVKIDQSYIGIYQGSSSPDLRRVVFTDFKVVTYSQ